MDSDRRSHSAETDQRLTPPRTPYAFVPRTQRGEGPRTPLAQPEPTLAKPAEAPAQVARSIWPTRGDWFRGAALAIGYCILVYGMLALCLSWR